MSLLQGPHRSQSVLLIVVVSIIGVLVASARPLWGQCADITATWKLDEIGYAYRESLIEGRWQRVYRQPERQAVAWEVSRHLPSIGLPATHDIRRTSGVDAFGRRWSRDALGYAYYETDWGGCIGHTYYQPERQSIAAAVHRQFAQVDWESSVRQGVAGAMVRGFNAIGVPGIDESTLRSVISERIVEGLNLAAAGGGSGNVSRFQQLVGEGVEDAIVQALNQIEIMHDGPGAATLQDGNEEADGDTSVLPDQHEGGHVHPKGSGPADGHFAHAVANTGLTFQNTSPIGKHYAGALDSVTFHERYGESRFVDAGWIIGPFGTRPVTGAGLLILPLRGDADAVEAWRDGILIFSDCHYAEYFEDAQQIAARFYKD